MNISRNTVATPTMRREPSGLLRAGSALTLLALLLPVTAAAQSLFSTTDSSLPPLQNNQYGTPGTTTITRNATTVSGTNDANATDGFTTLPTYGVNDPNDPAQPAAPVVAARPARAAGTDNSAQTQDEDLNQAFDPTYEPPLDVGEEPIDAQQPPRTVDPTGIRLGTFLLRPSISQSVNTETTKDNGGKETRGYLATGIRGSLTSDWSRHALTVNGESTFEKDFSGDKQHRDPEGRIDADLRLDLARDTVAHITGAYSFAREENDDPNAVSGAKVQSGVSLLEGGASLQRDIGRIRALGAVGVSRYAYSNAKLSDGTVYDMQDRNRTGVDGRLRLGYELSPALIPYVEIATGHTFYDRRKDNSGYERSSQNYAARTGVQFDFGEKLRGEIGTGYEIAKYDDNRLNSVDGITFDGKATWSPRRGTDVDIGLRTRIQDSTTPGESGWTEYELTSALAHQMRDNLIARLSGGLVFRNFNVDAEDDVTWLVGTGFTWSINRYLDLTGDVEYERTTGGTNDQSGFRAGIGIALKH